MRQYKSSGICPELVSYLALPFLFCEDQIKRSHFIFTDENCKSHSEVERRLLGIIKKKGLTIKSDSVVMST